MAGEHVVPVMAALAPLFPDGGLRRGTAVVVKPSAASADRRGAGALSRRGGSASLTLALAAAATQAGSWCAAVGWPAAGMVAAAGLGVALERFALVPRVGDQWAAVTAALIDAVDVIVLRPPRSVRSSEVRRLTARVRERGVVLVVSGGAWPEAADLSLSVTPVEWRGLGQGHGYLQARSVEVTSIGRGAASRERRVQLWLPGSTGQVEVREPAVVAVVPVPVASAVG